MLDVKARPRWQAGGRAAGQERLVIVHSHSTSPAWSGQPVCLAIHKSGRGSDTDGWCRVAKLTTFKGADTPILATAWQAQRGTDKAISLPEVVLDYAEAAGATSFYLQDRRRRLMWTTPLATFRRGALRPDGERYVPLAWLEPTPYREWEYAEPVLRLTPPPPPRRGPAALTTPAGRQLTLFGGAV